MTLRVVEPAERAPFTVAPGCGQTRSSPALGSLPEESVSPGLEFGDAQRELTSFRPLLAILIASALLWLSWLAR